jgi:hypothetical protein
MFSTVKYRFGQPNDFLVTMGEAVSASEHNQLLVSLRGAGELQGKLVTEPSPQPLPGSTEVTEYSLNLIQSNCIALAMGNVFWTGDSLTNSLQDAVCHGWNKAVEALGTRFAQTNQWLTDWMKKPDAYIWVYVMRGKWDRQQYASLIDALQLQGLPAETNMLCTMLDLVAHNYRRLSGETDSQKTVWPMDLKLSTEYFAGKNWKSITKLCPECNAPLAYWDHDTGGGGVDYSIESHTWCANPLCGEFSQVGSHVEPGPY